MIYDQDPELYDLQYQAYREDIPFYLRLADDLGSPILELGCGTGRVTEALARAGHQVVGVDASAAMLARARTRLGALPEGKVELVLDDMRNLALSKRFPLVIAPFNTLMHAYTVTDQDQTLASVRAHLEPSGVFALDLYVPRFGPMGVLRREAEWQGVGGEHAELFLLQEHEPERQLVHSRYYLDSRSKDGSLRRRVSHLTQRYFHRFELERALREAGLGEIRLFGDFGRAAYTADSRLMVVLAKAQG